MTNRVSLAVLITTLLALVTACAPGADAATPSPPIRHVALYVRNESREVASIVIDESAPLRREFATGIAADCFSIRAGAQVVMLKPARLVIASTHGEIGDADAELVWVDIARNGTVVTGSGAPGWAPRLGRDC